MKCVLRAVAALAVMLMSSAAVSAQAPVAPKFLTFAFQNDAHGWAGGSDGIDVTQDGGVSWQAQFRGRRVDQLIFVRRRFLFALADGAVLHTNDDGGKWLLVSQPQPALRRIAFATERDGFAVGIDGLLYATGDGAKTWHRAPFAKPVNGLCFSNGRDGFAGGAVTAPALGAFDGITATADGGRNWTDATRPPTAGLVGIAGHTLYCTRGAVYDLIDLGAHAGGGAYIFARSTDGARHWRTIATGGQVAHEPHVPQGPGTEATSMSAYSPRAMYIAGFCGACGAAGQSSFGATTDWGRTWENVTLNGIGFTSAPVFTSPHHGWIGARVLGKDHPGPDEVLRTDDAGRTWSTVYSTP